MMSGCFSPPGGGDPWAHDYEDDRLYRMSARKFNKHMAEKRRRYRINTALERLKYIILHVMRRNPEHFDKMEKADILDLTVKFLRAVQKREGVPGARPPPAHSHHRTAPQQPVPSRSSAPSGSNFRVYQDPSPQTSEPAASPSSSFPQRHQGRDRAGLPGTGFPGLKSRSGNIPSAVVRATPHDYDGTSGGAYPTAGHTLGHTSGFHKRPLSASAGTSTTLGRSVGVGVVSGGCSPTKRPASSTATSTDGLPGIKRHKPASMSSATSSFPATSSTNASTSSGEAPEKGSNPFSVNLEYRVHSAFRIHHRTSSTADHAGPTSPLLPPPPPSFLLHPALPHRFPTQGLFPPPPPGLHSTSGPSHSRRASASAVSPSSQDSDSATSPVPSGSHTEMSKSSSKTSELKIEIPEVEVHVPVGHQVSPPVAQILALPLAHGPGMWRPW